MLSATGKVETQTSSGLEQKNITLENALTTTLNNSDHADEKSLNGSSTSSALTTPTTNSNILHKRIAPTLDTPSLFKFFKRISKSLSLVGTNVFENEYKKRLSIGMASNHEFSFCVFSAAGVFSAPQLADKYSKPKTENINFKHIEIPGSIKQVAMYSPAVKIFLNFSGEVFALGYATNLCNKIFSVLTKIDTLPPISYIAAGHEHIILLTKDGTLITCGYNNFGQLGLGKNASGLFLPEEIKNFRNITQIATSKYHSVAINDNGQVFTWGRNCNGQLGFTPSRANFNTPNLVASLATHQIIQIALGELHSVFLTNNGEVLSFGNNSYSQLGYPLVENDDEYNEYNKDPVLLKLPKIKQIIAGDYHTLFVTTENKVMICGNNSDGQCGIDPKISDRLTVPQNIDLPKGNILAINAQKKYSLFAIAHDDKIRLYGCGKFPVLGLDSFKITAIELPESMYKIPSQEIIPALRIS